MSRKCQITGKKAMVGNSVSHSNKRTKRVFKPNLLDKKFYLASEGIWINLRVSAAGLRTINKIGVEKALIKAADNGKLF